MSLKKNSVSYVSWLILLLFTGAACTFFGMIIANMSKMNVIIVTAGILAGFFAVIFLLYYLSGVLVVRLREKEVLHRYKRFAKLMESMVIVLLLAIGLIVRIVMLSTAGEDADYFELAKVSANSMQSIQSVQGSVYYYCMLLHGLFRLVGNNWTAGILLQMALQLSGTLLFYLAVKRMIGRLPAVLVMCYMLFAPSSIRAGLTYSPQMLYLCIFALALLVVADYLRRNIVLNELPVGMWFYTILVGIMIGICYYTDISGILLALPLLCILMSGAEYRTWFSKIVNMILLYAAGRIAFGICIWIDAMMCDSSVVRVMDAWKLTYSSSGFSLDRLAQNVQIEFVILVAIACIGCVSFWRRKNAEFFTPCILMVIGMCVLITGDYTIDNMNGSYLLYVLLALQAAVSVTELFYMEGNVEEAADANAVEVAADAAKTVSVEPVKRDADTKPMESSTVNNRSAINSTVESSAVENSTVNNHRDENDTVKKAAVEKAVVEKNTAQEQEKGHKVELFENPLPLPKKHVKKTLDYAFIPEAKAMKYDVQVSDKDDYDYK